MPYLDRRDFIKTTSNILGAAALGGLTVSCREKSKPPQGGPQADSHWPGFKSAMCNECIVDQSTGSQLNWQQQCQIVADAGYKGIEVAAFTLVKEGVHEISPAGRRDMVSAMKDVGIECVGLHWLLTPPPQGLHFTTPDTLVRQTTIAYFHELIDFCGDLGGPYMILAKVANHAQQRGVKILIEPLAKGATDVVNTMAEALELAKQTNHPAVAIIFDFHNTGDETESFDVLLKKYFQYIHHVHVQEMDGKHLGTGTAVRDYVKAFQTLKDLKYDKWISLEVFDFSPGGKKIAEESMQTLKQIESQLL